LILRNEDLDRSRARSDFVAAFIEDLKWFGCDWDEGPDVGGPCGPYNQSERIEIYRAEFERLHSLGFVYPCTCSRQDVSRALQAPHAADDEPIYSGTCRSKRLQDLPSGTRFSWRFRVPDGEGISFNDGACGLQRYVCGKDFGDFVLWRHDDVPSYQLACVVDDRAMRVTEVVRGADLLVSTARQLLLYRALGWTAPAFYHCELVRDERGERLAKRHDALSLRALRESGARPESLRADFDSLS
jgi:glutamyl/glutaminyl-tRNA synthetase